MKYLLLILLCVACGDDKFRKVEKLEPGFRVLGIVASQPEISAAVTVNLEVLASNINGSGTVNGTYEACIDPGISRGARVSCAHDPSKQTGSYSITFGPSGVAAGAPVGIAVPDVRIGRNVRDRFNGVGYIVIFSFIDGGQTSTAFKRILVSDRPVVNINPGTITINPVGLPTDGTRLTATASNPRQVYDVINVDGSVETRTEQYEVAWYTNSGEFDNSKARIDEDVEFKGKTPPTFIMSIVRDERGGLSYDINQ